MISKKPMVEFVERAGGIRTAAVMLGISPVTVYAYLNGRRSLSPLILVTLNLFSLLPKVRFKNLRNAAEIELGIAA